MLTNWKEGIAKSFPRFWLVLYRYYGYRRFSRPRDLAVTKDSVLCIEGYPRSGNTFATMAFDMSQARPQRIAHHLHSPAQVIQAVRWRIPTIVLIRNPHDAVVSLAVYGGFRKSGDRLEHMIHKWIYFYESIENLRNNYVLATFEEIVTDFGRVVRLTNERFGTDFDLFRHTAENEKKVLNEISTLKGARFRGPLNERQVARPSEARDALKAEVSGLLKADRYKDPLAYAKLVYTRFTE